VARGRERKSLESGDSQRQ